MTCFSLRVSLDVCDFEACSNLMQQPSPVRDQVVFSGATTPYHEGVVSRSHEAGVVC